jgi:hypothetical protein
MAEANPRSGAGPRGVLADALSRRGEDEARIADTGWTCGWSVRVN